MLLSYSNYTNSFRLPIERMAAMSGRRFVLTSQNRFYAHCSFFSIAGVWCKLARLHSTPYSLHCSGWPFYSPLKCLKFFGNNLFNCPWPCFSLDLISCSFHFHQFHNTVVLLQAFYCIAKPRSYQDSKTSFSCTTVHSRVFHLGPDHQ